MEESISTTAYSEASQRITGRLAPRWAAFRAVNRACSSASLPQACTTDMAPITSARWPFSLPSRARTSRKACRMLRRNSQATSSRGGNTLKVTRDSSVSIQSMTVTIPASSRKSPITEMIPAANISPSASMSLVMRVTTPPAALRSNQLTGSRCRRVNRAVRISAMTRWPTSCRPYTSPQVRAASNSSSPRNARAGCSSNSSLPGVMAWSMAYFSSRGWLRRQRVVSGSNSRIPTTRAR